MVEDLRGSEKGTAQLDIKRWIAALALSVAFSAQAMDVSSPKGAFALKDKPKGGQPGFCAEELAAALKGTLGRDEVSHYPVLNLNGRRILLSTTSALASVDGKIVRLQQAPSVSEGCLWLPAEFLSAVLPQVLGGPVSVKGLEAKAAPAETKPESNPETKPEPRAVALDKGDSVAVESVVASDSVRITFLGRAALLGEVAQGNKDVTVTFPEATLAGSPGGLGKGIVDDLLFEKGGHRAKIQLGPGFKRFESVKLRNPDRLVLLFKGEGQRVASPAPEAPPAVEPEAAVPPMTGEPPKKSAAFDTVVLDPGHGGPDTGATTAGGLQEKNLTLALAQKTAALLEKEGIKAILTRSTDAQVPLMQRTALANFNRANLFLSIHLNSSPASSARGTETYYLSRNATDQWSIAASRQGKHRRRDQWGHGRRRAQPRAVGAGPDVLHRRERVSGRGHPGGVQRASRNGRPGSQAGALRGPRRRPDARRPGGGGLPLQPGRGQAPRGSRFPGPGRSRPGQIHPRFQGPE